MDNKPKAKVDPGWNDPPMLNYSPDNPPPKSRITNKRLAFPVFGSNPVTNTPAQVGVPSLNSSMPPRIPTLPGGISPPPSGLPMPSTDKNNLLDMNKDRVVECLGKYLDTEYLENFSNSWDNTFPEQLKTQLYLLSQNIISNNLTDVNRIKDILLTEYKCECESWLHKIN